MTKPPAELPAGQLCRRFKLAGAFVGDARPAQAGGGDPRQTIDELLGSDLLDRSVRAGVVVGCDWP